MLYIRLFHGRTDPNQDMNDWGTDRPVLGPYEYVHTIYAFHLILGKADESSEELFLQGDLLFYGGVYYGDWSVFDEQILRNSDYTVVPYESTKACLPQSAPS